MSGKARKEEILRQQFGVLQQLLEFQNPEEEEEEKEDQGRGAPLPPWATSKHPAAAPGLGKGARKPVEWAPPRGAAPFPQEEKAQAAAELEARGGPSGSPVAHPEPERA